MHALPLGGSGIDRFQEKHWADLDAAGEASGEGSPNTHRSSKTQRADGKASHA